MSENEFTEVSERSWFGRLGSSIKGVLIGIILFLVAFPLLFWNEGRAVKRYKTLKEGEGIVVSVPTDTVDLNNGGKLIHVTGMAATDETLSDPEFGVSANALKLLRRVEMYQWEEEEEKRKEKKVGGGEKTVTIYRYRKVWSEDIIDSSRFNHSSEYVNPSTMPITSREFVADKAFLGDFKLSSSLINKINVYESLPLPKSATPPPMMNKPASKSSQGFYYGSNPASPQIGDLHVTFEMVQPQTVSVVARQVNKTFEPYQTEAGGSIELLQVGTHSSENMFKAAHSSNKILTWILRLVGFILMFVGLTLIAKPLSVSADVIPFLGSIIEMGAGIAAFILALVLSLVTIGISWIVVRPIFAVLILVLAVGIIVGVKFYKR